MNIPFRAVLSALLVMAAAGCTRPAAPAARRTPVATTAAASETDQAPLLLISIDGYRADYLQRGLSPNLQRLANQGVRAQGMQPSFPSLTFPNHYTLVTGLRPDHHGIVHNIMSDPRLGHFSLGDRKAVSDGRWWDEATPLWETADAQGLRTATMFWPGSEADIHGSHPDLWQKYDASVTADQRVDQILRWLDLPAAQRPRFMTLYFDAVDHAGHHAGPDSAEVNQALIATDNALGRLFDGLRQRHLYDQLNLIVLADHGMASVPAENSILLDQRAPLGQVAVVDLGVLAGIDPKPGQQASFDAVAERLTGKQAHMQCWPKAQIPARLAYGGNPRVPALVCLADLGWRITTTEEHARWTHGPSLGEHGYDNQEPQMRALFIAHGPAFRSGAVVPEFPNVDVYPLMADLLNIRPEPNDGHLEDVRDMLREP